ncbi:DNA polymerase III subunit beta [Roseibium aggregatum]|uniref:Beta sliding clamp n=1 Tax=Roseibium aggregatum TaxID=187304 RepID=A0A0M6Y8F1_9HYPH|nr:DNA polymerase III subunit beta [Roseibium aggregatum]CTQ45689.1 DNA polymerase III subunit beta [Roseibium aggregatum]
MKFEIGKESLSAAIGMIVSVLDKKATVPLFGMVNIVSYLPEGNSDLGKIELYGTNGISEIRTTLEATVGEAGRIAVSGEVLGGIVKKLPSKPVKVEIDSSIMNVKCGRSKFKVTTLPELAPSLIDMSDAEVVFKAPEDSFIPALKMVAFAMSDDAARHYLNGVHIDFEDGKANLVATDGHRLARKVIEVDGVPGKAYTLPRPAVDFLSKYANGEVTVSLSANKITVGFLGGVYTSNLIDGTFPDYRRVIPETTKEVAEIDKDELSRTISLVTATSEAKTRAVRLSLSEGTLVTNAAAGGNEGKDEIEIDYAGPPITVGLNGKYLAEILSSVETPGVYFGVNDPSTPIKIIPTDDAAFTAICMPLRV